MSDFEDRVRRDLKRSADAVEPPPLLWRRVEDRLGHRDRRAVAFLAAAAVVVAAIAVFAVARNDGGGSEKHVASEAPSTTEPQGIVVPAEESTTTESTIVTTTSPSTTGRTTTTVGAVTTTTEPSPCQSQDLSVIATADKASYAKGDTVTIRGTAQNISPRTCRYDHGPNDPGCWFLVVKDANDNVIWQTGDQGGPPMVCPASLMEEQLAPGAYSDERPVITWDQRVCEGPTAPTTTTSTTAPPGYRPSCVGSQAPAGTYRGFIVRPVPSKPAAFEIS